MNTLMIVDDEAGVRNSIKAKIDWEAAGFCISKEAASGMEALQLLEVGPLPDVLMTDIRMPQMDGIELIRLCKQKFPEIKLVVLSGYSDFEYMQAAIQVGVKDYLLKPVGRKELNELLQKLGKEIAAERIVKERERAELILREQHLQASRESLLLRLVNEDSTSLLAAKERVRQLGLSFLFELGPERAVRFITAEMRIPAGRLGEGEPADLMHLAFRMLCRETAAPYANIYPFYDVSHPGMLHFLIMEENVQAPTADKRIEADRFVRLLRQHIRSFLRLEAVIGLGEAVTSLQQIKNAYSSSMLSWSKSTADGVHLHSMEGIQGIMNVITPELERQLVVAIESGDQHVFQQYMQRVLPQGIDYSQFSFTFIAMRLMLILHSVAKKYDDGAGDSMLQQQLWDCQTTIGSFRSREAVVQQLEVLGRLVIQTAQRARSSNGVSITAAVKKYMEENFAYELTLSGLADMFHLNETYLSGLFKQHVGVTFSEYLTRLRMHKAGELLSGSELKLTDIAMLVGISSSSYFSTSFKKFYGMSPKEYREEHSKRDK